ncbi:MAG TPA: hypothetical protein VHH88_04050 [Verrucomicrobiae bacterium]|nr:hypothetical protein [Verrucomicrobiae bacterium]
MPLPGENAMNWKKLSKEKKKQLVLVVIISAGVLGGLGFGLIRFQKQHLQALAAKRVAVNQKLKQMQESVKRADKVEAELAGLKQKLALQEEDMASGDLYAWMINTLRTFKLGYKVEIPQFSPTAAQGDMNLMPGFPYKQASVVVAGTAHFHDLGKFLADFENQYPHIRVVNLRVDASPAAQTGVNPEMVNFTMEVVSLVKPS